MARRKRRLTAKQKKRLKQAGWVAFGLGTFVVAREMYLAFGPRRENREALYRDAAQKAESLGRPLVVLGNPDEGLTARMLGRSWQCGNICVDPRGCPCGGPGQESVTSDFLPFLQDIAASAPGSVVIYDPGEALRQATNAYAMGEAMKAAAGGWDNVFVAGVERYTLASWFEPKTRRVMTATPPVAPPSWKPLWWHKDEGGSGGTVAALQARPWAYNGVRNIPARSWGWGDIPAVDYGSYAQSGLGTIVWENYPQG